MTVNVFTAIVLALAGFSLGIREIVLSPRNETFPCAPLAVRLAMFIAAAALCGAAVLFGNEREPYAGDAAVPVAFVSSVMALYNVIMCLNLLGQRYQPSVWKRINRVQVLARQSTRVHEVASLRRHVHR